MKKEIYINGFALKCALGDSAEEALRQIFAKMPQMQIYQHEALPMPVFTMKDHRKEGYIHDEAFRICSSAVQEALKMSFPETAAVPSGLRVGCVAGTTGDVQFGDLDFYNALKRDLPANDRICRFVEGTIAERILQEHDFTGPALTVSNTCVSGADAVLTGAQWIEADICDVVIAIGIDLISLMCLAGFYTLSAASTELCKPFDKKRGGMNVGEGCACVILRKKEIGSRYEELFSTPEFKFRGGGAACDAYHLTAPHPEGRGLQTAMRKALENACLSPEQIAFINAHGTGTWANDASEANAIQAVFGSKVPFFSTKGLTGHTLGASGTLELIFSMLCLKEQRIPGSFGCTEPAEDIPLTPNMALREISGSIAMSTSLAFGGCNTALIVERV